MKLLRMQGALADFCDDGDGLIIISVNGASSITRLSRKPSYLVRVVSVAEV